MPQIFSLLSRRLTSPELDVRVGQVACAVGAVVIMACLVLIVRALSLPPAGSVAGVIFSAVVGLLLVLVAMMLWLSQRPRRRS